MIKQEKTVEMWNVRAIYAIMRYLNLQKEFLAGEAPHLTLRTSQNTLTKQWKRNEQTAEM